MNRDYSEEWELISFFGQDSDPGDKDEAEILGCSAFTVRLDDGLVLTFTLHRNFGDLHITLKRGEVTEVNLAASDVQWVKIERLHGGETLLAAFGPAQALQQVRLTLRPTLQLHWGATFEG
jgi:hypothetical protein